MKQDRRLTIINWLTDKNRTAKAGIEIYKQYSRPNNILRNLERSTNQKHIIQVLDNQLRLLAGISPLTVLIPEKPKQNKPSPSAPTHRAQKRTQAPQVKPQSKFTDPYANAREVPEVLIPVYERKKKLYVEVKQMQAHLVALGDSLQIPKGKKDQATYDKLVKQRKEIADSILNHWVLIDDCWQQINHFAEHNKLVVPVTGKKEPAIKADLTDPFALDKRYSTVRTYISKKRKDIEKNRPLLTKYAKELNEIATALNKHFGEDKYKTYDLETFNA